MIAFRYIHRLVLQVAFPEGLSAGTSKEGNMIQVARDGSGRPVLRGTALAGVIRHAWNEEKSKQGGSADDERRFGSAQSKDGGISSHDKQMDQPLAPLQRGTTVGKPFLGEEV